MTYQSYSKGIQLIFTVLGLLFMLQQFGKVLIEHQEVPFILTVNYFALRIAALYLLFFSIYALLSKLKNLRKLESPISFIIIGTLFVITLYGPPIVAYFISHDLKIDFTHNHLQAAQVKKDAMNINKKSGERFLLARNYYLDTGEQLLYLGYNNIEILYAPDNAASKLRNAEVDADRKLKLSMANLKISALSLIGILVISVLFFSIYLWSRFPNKDA